MKQMKSVPVIPVVMFFFFSLFISSLPVRGEQFKLFRTKTDGNTLVLKTAAKIVQVQRSSDVKGYTLWKDGKAYISVSRLTYTPENGLIGILPPGKYILRINGTSVTILLDTVYNSFKVTLWGKQNAIVKPLWDGNVLVLASPASIVSSFYDGSAGMSIFPAGSHQPILRYISPHSRPPGPKVIGGTGGKTLIGQTLPAGAYTLTPGRGTADGIVKGHVVLEIN